MSQFSLYRVTDSAAVTPDEAPLFKSAPLGMRLVTLLLITFPFLGLAATPLLLWGWGLSWVDLGLLAGMYVLTVLGITVGFHRLFTHRSFATFRGVELVLLALGSMAVQGPMLKWVATHRRHHRHSDTVEDPHSPHQHGRGLWGTLRGAWHAHVGWFFGADPPDLHRDVPDLRKSRALCVGSALFPIWVALGLLIPAVLGGLLKESWWGAGTGLVWGGLVRIFLVHHVTWSINSACHLWGRRPFDSGDQSRNNLVFGVLGLGEGWHNTHHAFPASARHGLRWWEIDASYWVIRALEATGLAWNVRTPSPASLARKRG